MCDYVYTKGGHVGDMCNNKFLIEGTTKCKTHVKTKGSMEDIKKSHPLGLCTYMLTRGENKGNNCGVRISTEGAELCRTHLKSQEAKAKKAAESDRETCKSIVASGIKKGQECGRLAAEDSTKCTIHSKCKEVSLDANECEYIFTRGKTKGDRCNKKCIEDNILCNAHNKEKKLTAKNITKAQTNGNKCIYVYKRGKEKGNGCGKDCTGEDLMCKTHMKTSGSSDVSSVLSASTTKSKSASSKRSVNMGEEEETKEEYGVCAHVNSRGATKGEHCKGKAKDGPYCSRHGKPSATPSKSASKSKSTLLNEDEEEVATEVLNNVTKQLNIKRCKGKTDGKPCAKTANGKDYCMLHNSLNKSKDDDLLTAISENLADEHDMGDYMSEKEEELVESGEE